MVEVKKYGVVLLLILLVLGVGRIYGYDLATHLYIAQQTFDVWQSWDPQFYNALTSPEDSIRITTQKFYYIGLLLPDLIEPEAQEVEREIILRLDSIPAETTVEVEVDLHRYMRMDAIVHATITSRKWSPLKITDETAEAISQPLEFLGDYPNASFKKLYEMAQYARAHISNPADKAVIYGALMHVIHDLVGHMVLQPALYGTYFNIEADSMLYHGLLEYFETYHEILAQTYIPDWSAFSTLFIPLVYAPQFFGSNRYVYTWLCPSFFIPHYSFFTLLHVRYWDCPDCIENWQKNWQEGTCQEFCVGHFKYSPFVGYPRI